MRGLQPFPPDQFVRTIDSSFVFQKISEIIWNSLTNFPVRGLSYIEDCLFQSLLHIYAYFSDT